MERTNREVLGWHRRNAQRKPYIKKIKRRKGKKINRKEIAPDRRTKKNQNDRGRNSRRRRGNWIEQRAQVLTTAWVPRLCNDLRRPKHCPRPPLLGGMGTTRNPRRSGSGGSLRGQETVGGPVGMGRAERRGGREGGLMGVFASGGRAGEEVWSGLVWWKWKMRRSGAVQGGETCEAMAQAL